MTLRDILHKKNQVGEASPPKDLAQEFRFIRTDTNTEEPIRLPSYDGDKDNQHIRLNSEGHHANSFLHRRSRSTSPNQEKGENRLSHLLHLNQPRSRSNSSASINIPSDLPPVPDESSDAQEREAQWEKRATTLVQGNPQLGPPSQPSIPNAINPAVIEQQQSRSHSSSRANEFEGDVSLWE
jgi:hypothetical protein